MTWPSSFNPGTLGYMIDRIGDELARADLSTQIQVAVSDAITQYQKERFRFNETFTATFQTQVGQQNYNTITDTNFTNIAGPQQFYQIDWMTLTVPPAVFHMPRYQPEDILILTQTGTQMGQPYAWAFDNETIMLYPIPSSGGPGQINSFTFTGGNSYTTGVYANSPLSGGNGNSATANITVVGGVVTNVALVNPGTGYLVGDVLTDGNIGPGTGLAITVTGTFTGATGPYLMTCGGLVQYAAPTSTTQTGNRWMTDAERLIRSRAKLNLAMHVTRNQGQVQAMEAAVEEALSELRAEAARMTRRGILRPMYFLWLCLCVNTSLVVDHLTNGVMSWLA